MRRKSLFCIACRKMRARARALASWPSASRPWGFSKCASASSFSPRARSSRRAANASTLPDTCSAMATRRHRCRCCAAKGRRASPPCSTSRPRPDRWTCPARRWRFRRPSLPRRGSSSPAPKMCGHDLRGRGPWGSARSRSGQRARGPLFASMSTAPLAATLSSSEAQLPAPTGRNSRKSNMQINLFTARPLPPVHGMSICAHRHAFARLLPRNSSTLPPARALTSARRVR